MPVRTNRCHQQDVSHVSGVCSGPQPSRDCLYVSGYEVLLHCPSILCMFKSPSPSAYHVSSYKDPIIGACGTPIQVPRRCRLARQPGCLMQRRVRYPEIPCLVWSVAKLPQHPSISSAGKSPLNTNTSATSAATNTRWPASFPVDGECFCISPCTEPGHLYPPGLRSEIYHLEQHDPHGLALMLCLGVRKNIYIEPPCPTCGDSFCFLKITISPSHSGGHQDSEAGSLESTSCESAT